jgi:rare lipoprotein A (peptidoglycan hydrolase)
MQPQLSPRWILGFTLVALAFIVGGCSSQNFSPAPGARYYAPPSETFRGTRTEVASWYGPGFAGRPTSTGEIYNPNGLTAASTTLPLGSHVRVTNPDTGRSVVVRINDRGPYVRGRSIDLSHGAAQQIGLVGKGVGRVEVTPTARSTPGATFSRAAYADRTAVEARKLSYVSYRPQAASTRSERHHSRYRHYSSPRMVANPIGYWLASAIPRF